jgi:hypothetical protein
VYDISLPSFVFRIQNESFYIPSSENDDGSAVNSAPYPHNIFLLYNVFDVADEYPRRYGSIPSQGSFSPSSSPTS